MTQTNYLYDNCLIRICLILLLITYHAFCPFSSAAWTAPAGANPESYKWIAWIAYSCMLESFVFISGQILGFQVLRKGSEILNPRNLLVKKFNRLIIPSILFSLLYYLLFEDLSGFGVKSIVSIFGGTGHLWFLPMLFWCFCSVLILGRLRLKTGIIIPILILCSVLSVIKLPFQLSLTGYYFLFFFTGYLVGTKQWNVEKYINLKTITSLSLLFICVFPIASIIKHSDNYLFINNIIGGGKLGLVLSYSIERICQLTTGAIGTALIYTLANYLIQKGKIKIGPRMMKIASYCFGIYIYQEFILRTLYYKFGAVSWLEPHILPWVGILVTLALSIMLTHFTLKTRLGRFLIG